MYDLILGIPIVVLVPVVEAAKRAGLPGRYAGVAAVIAATALVAMAELARGEGTANDLVRWLLAGVVYGLAAVGLYSQAQQLPVNRSDRGREASR